MSDELARHLEREALLKREPWRVKLTTVRALYIDLVADKAKTLEAQKALFADLAKAGRLSPIESMVLCHTLYGDDDDKLFLGFLLSERSGIDQIRLHNWRVAARMPEQWLTANGHKVDSLSVPMFPPIATFSFLNTLILNGEPVVKGGGRTAGTNALYRSDVIEGGGSVPVVQMGTETRALTTDLEVWTEGLVQSEIAALRQELSDLKKVMTKPQPRQQTQQRQAPPSLPQPQRQFQPAQGQFQPVQRQFQPAQGQFQPTPAASSQVPQQQPQQWQQPQSPLPPPSRQRRRGGGEGPCMTCGKQHSGECWYSYSRLTPVPLSTDIDPAKPPPPVPRPRLDTKQHKEQKTQQQRDAPTGQCVNTCRCETNCLHKGRGNALRGGGHPNEIVARMEGYVVFAGDVAGVRSGRRVTDNVIHLLLARLSKAQPRYPFVSCFMGEWLGLTAGRTSDSGLAGIRRQLLRHVSTGATLIFAPVHTHDHWPLGIIDPHNAQLRIYDSMSGQVTSRHTDKLCSFLEAVFQQGPWTATFRPTYQQPKGSIECGLHLLVNAFAIAQGNCHEPAPGTIATYDYIRPGLANAITDETAFNALLAGFRVARGSPLSSGSPMGHVATILAQNNDQNQLAHDHEWQPFDKKTVDAHKRAANLFSVAVQQNFADCPFKELTKVLQHLETTRHWSPPTTLKFALDLRAAILRSPLETEIVHLHWFKDLLRMLKKRVARQANQAIRPHMLVPEALILIERAKTTSDELAAWIALTWLTAGRPSNTLRLTTLNLRDVTQAGFTILWTDAKTVGTTGPYSTFSGWGRHRFLQAYLESQLTRATESRAPTNLFPTLRRTAHRATRTLLSHIRRVNPAYDSRTMRRGTLIAMAEAGTPDATLLQLSGHRTMTTLYRYLAWGRHNSVARDTLQACANDTL